jgi:hypothetical protein
MVIKTLVFKKNAKFLLKTAGKLAKIAENWRKLPKIGENRWKLAKIAENRWKLAKIAINNYCNIDPWRFPETSRFHRLAKEEWPQNGIQIVLVSNTVMTQLRKSILRST